MAIEQENIWEQFGKKGYSDVNQMKIVPDKQAVVRLLPKKKNAKETIFQYSSHWVEQTTGVRFPIFHDVSKSCPICKFVQQLWADVNELKDNGLTDDSEEVKKKKDFIYSINAKASYDINVLDRKNYEDEEGNIIVKRWTVGNAIFLPLQELGKDPEWGSPTHDEEGYDIRVMGTKQGMGTKYNVSGSKTTSPLTDEEIEALNKRGYDLATLRSAEFTTDEKINEILKNAKIKQLRFLSDEKKQEEDDEEGVVRLSRPRAKTKSLLDDDEDEQTVTKKRPLLDDDEEDDVPVSTKKKKPVDDEDEPVSTKKKKPVDDEEDEPVSSKKKKPAVDEEEPVSTKKKKQVDEEEDEEPASTTSKKKKPVDDEEDEEPVSTKKKKPTVVDDEEDEPAPTTSKKKKQTVDEEDEEPVSSKKKKPVVDDEEDEPAPTTSKKKKPVDEEETSSKKKKKIDEDEDDDDEEITPAPGKKQVETKKQDEEDEPSSKVITEFDSFECKGMHDPKDSACNECEFIDECVELQELAEQAEGLGLEVREKDMVKSKSEILKMMKTVKTKKIDF